MLFKFLQKESVPFQQLTHAQHPDSNTAAVIFRNGTCFQDIYCIYYYKSSFMVYIYLLKHHIAIIQNSLLMLPIVDILRLEVTVCCNNLYVCLNDSFMVLCFKQIFCYLKKKTLIFPSLYDQLLFVYCINLYQMVCKVFVFHA